MTQNEDSGSAASRPPPPFCLLLPLGLGCALPDTWANRRGAMIVLRGWRQRAGGPLVTEEYLAQACGEADRRTGHNFWAECEACGAARAAFLPRRKQVDTEVVARCEPIGKAPPFWTCPPVLAACRRGWPAQGAPWRAQHRRTAGHQVGCLGGQQVWRRQWAEGDVHAQEPLLLAALCDLAEAGAHARAAAALPVRPLPDLLAAVSPAGTGPEPLVAPAAASVAACEDPVLQGEGAPSKLAQRWHGATGATLLAFILSDQGVSLEVIGRLCGVHNTTLRRWLSPLAQVNWQAAVPPGQRWFAGTRAVEAKWGKSAGLWWYRFVAVDHGSGWPGHVALWPSHATSYWARCLLPLKAVGAYPQVIIPDGWDAYVTAIARVFPKSQPRWGRLPALRAAWRRLRAQGPRGPARRRWADTLKALFPTPSQRTVRRRLNTLQAEAQGRPAHAVVPRLLAQLPQRRPAVGATWRPTTSHAAARFLGALERFYRLKGPCQNLASAQKPVDRFRFG